MSARAFPIATAAPPSVKGWCPGALRPMLSGDGLLVRLRITGGIVPSRTLSRVGDLAAHHGNGLIDISQRANLQIRGVRSDTHDPLIADLRDLGLIDTDPGAEAVRNVVGSPLAGLDATAKIDGAALVAALEARLREDADLHALPDKFGFLVDDGGRLSLCDVAADVRLTGTPGGLHLAIGGDGSSAAPVAMLPPADAVAGAVALARAFLVLRGSGDIRRMRDLVRAVGVDAIRSAAGLAGAMGPWPTASTRLSDILGVQPGFVGVGAPFGRFTAAQVRILADVSAGEVRLTPWRAVLVPGVDPGAAAVLAEAGLILDPRDARLSVAACPGRPDCPSGAVDTREAATVLAPLVAGRDGVVLHVSGCSKGCARPRAAPVTLSGRDGLFDLIVDGRADGAPIHRDLDLAGARAAVETLLSKLEERP